MSWAEAGAVLDTPGITMLGFRSVPSSSTWWSLSACGTNAINLENISFLLTKLNFKQKF